MFKQSLSLILLSIAIVLCTGYAQQAVQLLINSHSWVSKALNEIFAGGPYGHLVHGSLALLCIPILAGLIPTVFYYMSRKHLFPYFMQVVWVVWLIQAGALIMVYKVS